MSTTNENTRPVALITGATSGLGLEMARQLAAKGRNLVLVGRRAEALEKLAQDLRAGNPATVHAITVDLALPGSAAQLYAAVRKLDIQVDWLINNAGVGIYGDHLDLDTHGVERMLQLNVVTVSELCQLFGADMRARRAGRILNIASTAAYQPSPYFAAYGASKSFVLNFSEALAKELEDYGVTVSCLSPGPTATAFFREVDAKGLENGHFDRGDRDDPVTVAAMGIELMLSGRLSKIAGTRNYLRSLSSRVAPRSVVASISKRMLAASRTAGRAEAH
jgi:uncharacterized protein